MRPSQRWLHWRAVLRNRIVSVSDYSASNIKGYGPYTNQANPATDNFVVNSEGEFGSPTQISFETTDGGANYIAHDGPGGAEVGACYRDTDEVATEPTGCCPQIESVASLLYCSSAGINC